jgi:hypothetical protein
MVVMVYYCPFSRALKLFTWFHPLVVRDYCPRFYGRVYGSLLSGYISHWLAVHNCGNKQNITTKRINKTVQILSSVVMFKRPLVLLRIQIVP